MLQWARLDVPYSNIWHMHTSMTRKRKRVHMITSTRAKQDKVVFDSRKMREKHFNGGAEEISLAVDAAKFAVFGGWLRLLMIRSMSASIVVFLKLVP